LIFDPSFSWSGTGACYNQHFERSVRNLAS
jgi:hypothetical protein